MHTNPRQTLALVGGLGLLAACPLDPSATSGDTNTTTSPGTTEEPGTSNPSTEPPGTDTVETTVVPTTTDSPTTTDPTEDVDAALCVALGGTAGVAELVDAAVAGVLVDDRINAYFLNSDVDGGALKTCLGKQLGALAGCAGVVYDCLDMKAAHAGLGISAVDFADFAGDFGVALDAHQATHSSLSDGDKETILTALAGMSADIVEDPDNNLTLYQRLGRKPAIRAFVGMPGQASSFVDTVAINPLINNFFGTANFERLNTCLTRQLSSIDGPSKYGAEVDAPAPADPGVSAADPCKSMADAHAGVTDPGDNSGIDILDFAAFVGDFISAMTTAGVAQPDQDALLAALDAMCEDVVAAEWKNECPTAHKIETVELTDLAAAIPDDGYDGSEASMLCHELVVPDDPINFVKDIQVTVAIDHSWLGDLTIKLFSPENKVLTIVSRPGLNEFGDNGLNCCGDSSDVVASTPLIFKDDAVNNAEQLGAAIAQSEQVVCVDDGIDPCEWSPNPGAGPGMSFADFFGDTAAGPWKLCVADSYMNQLGTLHAIKLDITRVKYDPMP